MNTTCSDVAVLLYPVQTNFPGPRDWEASRSAVPSWEPCSSVYTLVGTLLVGAGVAEREGRLSPDDKCQSPEFLGCARPCNLYFKFLSNPNVLGRKRASDYNKKNKCESAIHEKRRLWPVFCDGEAIPYRGIIEADEAALLQKRVQTRSRIVNTRCSKVCCSLLAWSLVARNVILIYSVRLRADLVPMQV